MKSTLPRITILAALTLTFPALAHDGEHAIPGNVQAPKGGMIRSTEDSHFELLVRGKKIELYGYALNLKPMQPKDFTVESNAVLPKKKSVPVGFRAEGNRYVADFDPQGAHRYTLELAVKTSAAQHKLKFTVEPKR